MVKKQLLHSFGQEFAQNQDTVTLQSRVLEKEKIKISKIEKNNFFQMVPKYLKLIYFGLGFILCCSRAIKLFLGPKYSTCLCSPSARRVRYKQTSTWVPQNRYVNQNDTSELSLDFIFCQVGEKMYSTE